MKTRDIMRLKAKARSDLAKRHEFLEKDLLLEANKDVLCHYFWLPFKLEPVNLEVLDSIINRIDEERNRKKSKSLEILGQWKKDRQKTFARLDKFIYTSFIRKLNYAYRNVRNNQFNFPNDCKMVIAGSNFKPFMYKDKLVYMYDYIYQLEMLQLFAKIEGKTEKMVEQTDFYGGVVLHMHALIDGYISLRKYLQWHIQNLDYTEEFLKAFWGYKNREVVTNNKDETNNLSNLDYLFV